MPGARHAERCRGRHPITVLVVAALVAGALAWAPNAGATARRVVPAQFVAKTYTEVLGRAPDDAAWNGALHHFHVHGCSAAHLAAWAMPLYASGELRSLRYGPEATAMVVYRGVLNRDPDAAGFATWRRRLARGASAADMAASLFASAEFARRATAVCTRVREDWSNRRPLAIGPELDGAVLNAMLLAAPPGSVVALEPRTIVRLKAQLVIPAGVTLTTKGVDHRQRYADMARIVRDRDTWVGDDVHPGWTGDQLVRIVSGGSLRHVWVDGQRNRAVDKEPGTVTVYAELGPLRTVIAHNKVENSPGDQTIKVGDDRYRPGHCTGADVVDNLVTAYSSAAATRRDGRGLWTDGIFTQCNGTRVVRNEVVDATDVGIIAMRGKLGAVSVTVAHNRVLQAGNNAFGGLVADSYQEGTAQAPVSFRGTRFSHNVLGTGPHTQYAIAISVGTRAWGLSGVGSGARFVDNTTGGMGVRATQFLSVNGMRNATTARNGGRVDVVGNFGNSVCATRPSVANTPVLATGALQAHEHHDNTACIRP